MTAAADLCCESPTAIAFANHLMRVREAGVDVLRPIQGACGTCGVARLAGGGAARLSVEDARAVRDRALSVQRARDAVAAGVAHDGMGFPHPRTFSSHGWLQSADPTLLYDFRAEYPHSQIRSDLLSIYGLDKASSRRVTTSFSQEFTLDGLLVNHVFAVDEKGRNNVDCDHLRYAPLVERTLQHPLEVWRVQSGGIKTLRTSFLAAYELGSELAYHLVLAARNRLLTAYRLNGGMAAFASARRGVPVFVAY